MSIAAIVTRGFAFGSIAEIVTRGYALGDGVPVQGAVQAPGPLFLSAKAYRDLKRRRLEADDELERLRQAEIAKRQATRAMIGRAVRGEAEPVEEPIAAHVNMAPTASVETKPVVGQLIKAAAKRMAAGKAEPEVEDFAPRIAAAQAAIEALEAKIAAHEQAMEEDDMETLLMLVV